LVSWSKINQETKEPRNQRRKAKVVEKMPPLNAKQKAARKRKREGGDFAPENEKKQKMEEEKRDEGDQWEGFSTVEVEKVEQEFLRLKWKEPPSLPGKASYAGDSERNQRRKRAEEREKQETAKGCLKISQMWSSSSASSAPASSTVQKMTLEEGLEKLEVMTRGRSRELISNLQYSRFLTLRLFFTYLKQGEKKEVASIRVSRDFAGKGPWHARLICQWGEEFLWAGDLCESFQGAHPKTPSLIEDPAFKELCQEWASSQPPEKRTPLAFKKAVQDKIFPELGLEGKIHENTCRAYLEKMGYSLRDVHKDVYFDGHEREDVKDYRKEWVARMLAYEKRMSKSSFRLEGEKGEEEGESELSGKPVVQVTHDECCFFANDGKNSLWLAEEEQLLRKKGEGKPLMVSGFLCPCHGIVDLAMISPGKNADGYWQNEHMLLHVSSLPSPFPLLLLPFLFFFFPFSPPLFSSFPFPFPLFLLTTNPQNPRPKKL